MLPCGAPVVAGYSTVREDDVERLALQCGAERHLSVHILHDARQLRAPQATAHQFGLGRVVLQVQNLQVMSSLVAKAHL